MKNSDGLKFRTFFERFLNRFACLKIPRRIIEIKDRIDARKLELPRFRQFAEK